MLRVGIVDCDTSHVYEFSRRINHVGIAEDQWVDGARVVAAWPGTSRIVTPERLAEFVGLMREAGVELVDRPEELIGKVDAVLVESNEGSLHRARATPFLEAGLPVFIDKPFAATAADAQAMVEIAARRGVPLISASSLRFVPEIGAVRSPESPTGALVGADVHTPAALSPFNPGLLHYAVHGVELLYALLGPGCVEVSRVFHPDGEVVVGRWRDGRLGTVRGLRRGKYSFGFVAYGENGNHLAAIDTRSIYRDLLAVVIPVLAGAPSPISPAELIEVVAFQEAALASSNNGGRPVAVQF